MSEKCGMIPPKCTCNLVPPFHDGRPCPVHGLTKPTKWPANILEITEMLPDNMTIIAKERLEVLELKGKLYDELPTAEEYRAKIAELEADRKIVDWLVANVHYIEATDETGWYWNDGVDKPLRESILTEAER